jgi:hypothetical protein
MTTTLDIARRDAVIQQLFLGAIGALETLHIYVGDRLDLYVALAEIPDTSPGELATRAGIAQRYAREWLEQQAVAGLLDVVRDDGDPATRRYRLPAEVAEVMTQADSLNYLAPLAPLVASLRNCPQCSTRSEPGRVPYAAYGEDLRRGIARLNGPCSSTNSPRLDPGTARHVQARLRSTETPPASPTWAVAAAGRASRSPAPIALPTSTAST